MLSDTEDIYISFTLLLHLLLKFSYIVPWDSKAFQHGREVFKHLKLQSSVTYPPDDRAGLVWSQCVSQQYPGQQHRPVMIDVTKGQQQLTHLLDEEIQV